MRRFKQIRYIPEGSTERRFEEIPAVVYLYTNRNGKPTAIAYGGKRNKPDWHYNFPSEERREERITEWIEGLKAHAERIKEYRQKRKSDPSRHALGAKNLKLDLEKNFPGVKFSVRSDSFSMGDAIRVSWTDGPTTDQVSMIGDRYQHGHFNGMEDIYEYDHEGDYSRGSAKYVSYSRDTSKGNADDHNNNYNDLI